MQHDCDGGQSDDYQTTGRAPNLVRQEVMPPPFDPNLVTRRYFQGRAGPVSG